MTWETIKYVVVALLSIGGAAAIRAFFWGFDLWRSGTARTEARGIANLERQRIQAEHATMVERHKVDYYRDELVPFLRRQIAVQERAIIVIAGVEAVPNIGMEPVMRPLPIMPALPRMLDDKKVTEDVDADG
jgi:hypothetical protein